MEKSIKNLEIEIEKISDKKIKSIDMSTEELQKLISKNDNSISEYIKIISQYSENKLR